MLLFYSHMMDKSIIIGNRDNISIPLLYKYWKRYTTIPVTDNVTSYFTVERLKEFITYSINRIKEENGKWRETIDRTFGWNEYNLDITIIDFALLIHIIKRLKTNDIDFIYLHDIELDKEEADIVAFVNTELGIEYNGKVTTYEWLYSNKYIEPLLAINDEVIKMRLKQEIICRINETVEAFPDLKDEILDRYSFIF